MNRLSIYQTTQFASAIDADDSNSVPSHVAATLQGPVVDKLANIATGNQFGEAGFLIHVPDSQGGPASLSIVVSLLHGTTSSPATTVTPNVLIPTPQLAADGTTGATSTSTAMTITKIGTYFFPFSPTELHRYYRVNAVLSFSGGSSPKNSFSIVEIRKNGVLEADIHVNQATLGVQQTSHQ